MRGGFRPEITSDKFVEAFFVAAGWMLLIGFIAAVMEQCGG